MASVVRVMPSWAPDRWNDSLLWALRTECAGPSPRFSTSVSIADRSSPVTANSNATKSPVPAVSAMKPTTATMFRNMSMIRERSYSAASAPVR